MGLNGLQGLFQNSQLTLNQGCFGANWMSSAYSSIKKVKPKGDLVTAEI